jgi:CDP-2,3-bis-(O-geranylgeranyl)-sn-glycerol synthase
MTPPLARKANLFNFLDKEIDFGKKFLGQPILGSHKSWRGALLGIVIGLLAALIQGYLYQFPVIQRISLIDYGQINIFIFGLLISTGAVLGDLIFAFIKRRLKMKPGARFIPFDQTNYVIGSAIFLTVIFKIGIIVWITVFILTFLLHIIANRIGYHLKLNRAKW